MEGSASPAPAVKTEFVFPVQELKALCESSQAALTYEGDISTRECFDVCSACIVPIGKPSVDYPTHAAAVREVLKNNPERLAKYGNVGVEKRFKAGDKAAASLLFTKESLSNQHDGTVIINKFLDLQTEQIPSYMLTTPKAHEATKDGKRLPFWMFVQGNVSAKTDDGFIPVAIVAETECVIHFVPHAAQLRQEWDKFTAGGKYNGGAKTGITSFNVPMRTCLGFAGVQHWAMKPGDVFVTHRGMPFHITPAGEDETAFFLAQTVVVNVLPVNNKRRTAWAMALKDNGVFKKGKFGEELWTDFLIKSGDSVEEYKPIAAVAKEEDVPWLTKKEKAKRKKPATVVEGKGKKREKEEEAGEEGEEEAGEKKVAVADPTAAAAAPVPVKKGGKVEIITVDGVEVKATLQAQFVRHLETDNRIAHLNPRIWDKSLEKTANEHRNSLRLMATTAPSAKITAYSGRIDTLQKAVLEAEQALAPGEDGTSLFDKVCAEMDESKTILDQLDSQMPEAFKAEKNTLRSCVKKYEELNKDGHKLCAKKGDVAALLDRCKKLQESVAERMEKKQKTSPKPSMTENGHDSASGGEPGEVDLEDVEFPIEGEGDEAEFDDDRTLEGNNLNVFVREAYANCEKYQIMAQKLDRDDVRQVFENFRKAVNESLGFCRNKDNAGQGYNVGKIELYMKPLSIAYERMASAVSSTRASGKNKGVIECKDGTMIKIGNGRMRIDCSDCGERKPDFANNKCQDCFTEELEERIRVLDDHEDAFNTEAKNAKQKRLQVKRTNTTLDPIELAYKEYLQYAGKIRTGLKQFYANKDYLSTLIPLIEKAEELVLTHLDHLDDGEGAGGGDDDDDGRAGPMDIDGEEDEEDELEEEEEEFIAGEEDEDEVVEGSPSSSASSDAKKKNTVSKKGDNLVALRIADRIVRIRSRVPIERALNDLHAWYEKGDEESLQRANLKLKDLEAMTVLWGVKAIDGKPYPFFFAEKEDAEDKMYALKGMTPNVTYELYQKPI